MKLIKKLLISIFLIALTLLAIVFAASYMDSKPYSQEWIDSTKDKSLKQERRVAFVKKAIETSVSRLKLRLELLDYEKDLPYINTDNILYAVTDNKEVQVTVSVPYINETTTAKLKTKNELFQHVLHKAFNTEVNSHEMFKEGNEKKLSIYWYGELSVEKLNIYKDIVFFTVAKSIVDKAMRDEAYNKDFQAYISSGIGHEYMHMLDENEYLASKYGQQDSVLSNSAEILNDLYNSRVIDKEKYTQEYYKSKYALKIDGIASRKNIALVEKMLEVLEIHSAFEMTKKEVFYTMITKDRVIYKDLHKFVSPWEYHLILTEGDRFMNYATCEANIIYCKSKATGWLFNSYRIFKDKGYTLEDIKTFNKLCIRSILDVMYGKNKENESEDVQKHALNSLNLLVEKS